MKQLLILLVLVFTACSSNDPGVSPPVITTAEPTDITFTSATITATIESAQPDQITVRGVCWARNPAPELDKLSSKTEDGAGAGTFTTSLTGLNPNKYYVRAYAKVRGQVFYGNEVTLDISALVPAITTTKKAYIDNSSLEVETAVTYTHSLPITEKGICWSTTNNPTITTAAKVINAGTDLTFLQVITSLSPWTAYYVRGYAITDLGVFYGNSIQVIILPPVSYGSITDIDGNTYPTTQIGSKVWMAENLKVTRYNDGTTLNASGSQDEFKNAGSGSYIPYGGSAGSLAAYGYLYNGYVVTSAKNVCMTGWHLPSPSEWSQLAANLGGMDTAGGRMKEVSNLWSSPNVAADNESGFSALPGGSYCRVCLSNTGIFADEGTDGYWWSSTPNTFYYVTNDLASMRTKSTAHVNDGLSIRCVKD